MVDLQAQKLEKMDRSSLLSRRANTPEKKAQGIYCSQRSHAGFQYVKLTDSKVAEHIQ